MTSSEDSGGDADTTAGLFELLSDGTRVRIIQELYRQRLRTPEEPCLPFSTLYARVDARDSGRFNYHLDRLSGVLVDKHEAGYTLSPAGVSLGRLIASDATPDSH